MFNKYSKSLIILIIIINILFLGTFIFADSNKKKNSSWSPYEFISDQDSPEACIYVHKPEFISGSENTEIIMKIKNYCYTSQVIILEIRLKTDQNRIIKKKKILFINGLEIRLFTFDFKDKLKKNEFGKQFHFNWGLYKGASDRLYKFKSMKDYYNFGDVLDFERNGFPLSQGDFTPNLNGIYYCKPGKISYSSYKRIPYTFEKDFSIKLRLAPIHEQTKDSISRKIYVTINNDEIAANGKEFTAYTSTSKDQTIIYGSHIVDKETCISQWLYMIAFKIDENGNLTDAKLGWSMIYYEGDQCNFTFPAKAKQIVNFSGKKDVKIIEDKTDHRVENLDENLNVIDEEKKTEEKKAEEKKAEENTTSNNSNNEDGDLSLVE